MMAMNQDPASNSSPVWDDTSLEVAEPGVTRQPLDSTPPPKKPSRRRKKRQVIALTGTVLAAAAVGMSAYALLQQKQEKPEATYVINTQSLDNGTLNELTGQADGLVKQQLTISPDTIFKNSVTVQGPATVENDLTVRGKTVLQGSTSVESDLSVNRSLTVVGNTSLASNLNVNGQISAASLTVGSLTISSINLSSNLNFAGHLIPNGPAPAPRASTAAGGGSVTVSGNDTSGTIVINTGNSFMTPGELAIVTFQTPFNTTPKVQLTPVNDAASALNYYATRSATFFTISSSSAASQNRQYVFDYLVTQ